jgi:phospholipid/cholesterol/gamma-HCH transport system permease protein
MGSTHVERAPQQLARPPATQPLSVRGGPDPLGGVAALLDQTAGMILLGGRTILACVTPPPNWRDDFVEEAWLLVRRCTFPVVLSTVFFGFAAPGVQADNLLSIFGTVDRSGAFFVMASVREFAPWTTAMVLAGVGGTAVCADLGARKVREELDALAVLGLDPVRTLVVPRFLALGCVTAAMNMIALLFGVVGGWIAAVPLYHANTAGFVATFTSNFTMPDLLGSAVKASLFGLIIAIVCCYKGMNVKGGAEGVGRAVNQAVVISFVAVWVVNYMFTTTLLAAFPETSNLH